MARADADDLKWLRRSFSGFRNNPGRYKSGTRAFGWRADAAIIHRLNERFPGSAEIFLGPMGQILLGRKLTEDELIWAITGLGDPYLTILLGGGYATTSPAGKNRHINDLFAELEQFVDFGVLQAIVYMLSWADRISNHDTWNATCSFYRHMIPQIIFHESCPHHECIFDAIDAIALLRTFKANNRKDMYRSWRRELPKVKKLREQHAFEVMRHWEMTSSPVLSTPNIVTKAEG